MHMPVDKRLGLQVVGDQFLGNDYRGRYPDGPDGHYVADSIGVYTDGSPRNPANVYVYMNHCCCAVVVLLLLLLLLLSNYITLVMGDGND